MQRSVTEVQRLYRADLPCLAPPTLPPEFSRKTYPSAMYLSDGPAQTEIKSPLCEACESQVVASKPHGVFCRKCQHIFFLFTASGLSLLQTLNAKESCRSSSMFPLVDCAGIN